jgi:hypothetical protein
MKKTTFRQPVSRPLPAAAESWVTESANSEPLTPKPAATGKGARLTIDLPTNLHADFKAACAKRRTRMVDEVRQFIEEWVQKNS